MIRLMIECYKVIDMKFAKQFGAETMAQNIIKHDETESVRLNKYISESGFASRREADRLIQQGRVSINGTPVGVGVQVYPGDSVSVDDTVLAQSTKQIYIALHKPVGITSTTNLEDKTNMITFMNYPETLFPIGRLDKDSRGLILLTNDGDIVNKILREEYGHDKEYIVTVNKRIDKRFVDEMASGVSIYNQKAHRMQVTGRCEVTQIGPKSFKIILRQGLNRQIRRMTQALGFKVVDLKRERIMGISLNDLPNGHWRYLSESELIDLNTRISQ